MERRDSESVKLTSEEAAEWFVRIRDGTLSPSDKREYLAWLKRSPVNVAEALRMGQLYGLIRGGALGDDALTARDGQGGIADGHRRNGEARASVHVLPAASAEPPATRDRFYHWKIAAGICALGVAGIIALATKVVWLDRTIQTAAGEWRNVTLSDGTVAELVPRSQLDVDFRDDRRVVHLSRGQALFDVAPDSDRPFYVNAGLATARAVGTKFGVERVDERVVVTVAEGLVDVTAGGSDAADARIPAAGTSQRSSVNGVLLRAGSQLTASSSAPPAVRAVDAERALAWARRWLIFEGTSIGEAVATFNRLNRVQIELASPEVAALTLDGRFKAGDPESFVQVVLASPTPVPLALVRDGENILRLVPDIAARARNEKDARRRAIH